MADAASHIKCSVNRIIMESDDESETKDVPPERGKMAVRQRTFFPKSPHRPSPYRSPSSKASPRPLKQDKFSKFSEQKFTLPFRDHKKLIDKVSTKTLKSVKSAKNLSANDLSDPLLMPPDIIRAMKKTDDILALQAPGNSMDCREPIELPVPIGKTAPNSPQPPPGVTPDLSKSQEFSIDLSTKRELTTEKPGMLLNIEPNEALRAQFQNETEAIAMLKQSTDNETNTGLQNKQKQSESAHNTHKDEADHVPWRTRK